MGQVNGCPVRLEGSLCGARASALSRDGPQVDGAGTSSCTAMHSTARQLHGAHPHACRRTCGKRGHMASQNCCRTGHACAVPYSCPPTLPASGTVATQFWKGGARGSHIRRLQSQDPLTRRPTGRQATGHEHGAGQGQIQAHAGRQARATRHGRGQDQAQAHAPATQSKSAYIPRSMGHPAT